MSLSEIISDPTRRVQWLASYGIDQKLTPLNGTNTSIYIKAGTVSISGGPTVSWAGGYIIAQNPFYGSRPPVGGGLALPFVPNGTHQLYVDATTGNITMAVSSPGASFPAGSLPLYVITTDGVNRFNNLQDVRPATAGMQATAEVVSNSAYRASYGNSFAFDEVNAQNGGAYTAYIGDGVIAGINPYHTKGKWWAGRM